MLSRSLPRFLLQAGLLIAAASIAAVVHLGAAAIVLVMAAAFALVLVGELLARREGAEPATRTPAADAASRPLPAVSVPARATTSRASAATSSWLPVSSPPAAFVEPEVRPAPVWPSARPATPAPPCEPLQGQPLP